MQPTMLPKLTDTTQTITFTDNEDGQQMVGEVYATDVLVTTNAGAHSHGSSKVKLKSLVDYNWEPKLYSGQLLAVHLSGKYLAYCIKAPNPSNHGTWCGMVRVVYNPEPGTDRRALIKGMKGEVQDLAFAHIQNEVVLACIDEQGNFYVHEIEVTDSGLRCTLIAEVREDTGVSAMAASGAGGSLHRVVWCPYIPDDDDAPDDDVARLLLTTHCNIARMWNISCIVKCIAGAEGRGDASALLASAGALAASEHSALIVDAAFSPDGTALATASHDGYVMFFQVYMVGDSSPRCLHKWQPHGGKPLSCLFFLDNHHNYNTDVQFWKFAVTGADQNTVIKIWSCKSWNCLQTITFKPAPPAPLGAADPAPGLKAMLDTSASYLMLSDFRARSLYVLNMARDKDDTMAYCKSVSEYMLPYPVLSFCILDAEEDVAPESVCESPFTRNGSSASAEPVQEARGVRLRLYIVQPKGLQEGELLFVPPHCDMLIENNNQQNISFPDLSDLALEDKPEIVSGGMASSILQQQSQQLKALLMRAHGAPGLAQRDEHPPLNLMTPDAFSSPGKRDEDDPPLAATPEVGPRAMICEDNKLISGGSSPSREVQEIMAHNSGIYKDDDLPNEEEEESTQTPLVEEEDGESSVIQNGTDPIFPANDIFVSPEKPASKLTHSSSDTSWPQISLAQISEANQRKASSDKSSCQSLNNSLNVSAVERAPSEEPRLLSGLSPADKTRLEALENKLDKLCDLVMQQSRELRSMRGELVSPRDLIDEALHAHAQRTAAAIESALADGWERISRVGETASSRAAQAAGVGAARALEPLAAALQHELAAKLTATDHLLRDNIEKLANSKTVMEHLSVSIASSLSDMVREQFRGALLQSVLPVMEKAHAQIFRQINHAFQTGTKEFAANTEACARAAAERGGAAATASLRGALERHAEALSAAAPPAAVLAATLKDVAHGVLEKELSWWREQARAAAAHMSRAHSPATPAASHSAADRQMQVAQIQSLMSAGDMNGAFQLALSASDLALVVAACRGADPAAVFGPPCRLKQHVLLSLVQQLAADMPRDTLLKHRYLEEAIMNLDTSNPVTREHLPTVVRELQKQIMSFLSSNPQHSLQRQFKMLLMATDSLVKTV